MIIKLMYVGKKLRLMYNGLYGYIQCEGTLYTISRTYVYIYMTG